VLRWAPLPAAVEEMDRTGLELILGADHCHAAGGDEFLDDPAAVPQMIGRGSDVHAYSLAGNSV